MTRKLLLMLGLASLLGTSPIMAQRMSPELKALDEQLPGSLVNDPTSLAWENFGADYEAKAVEDPAIPGGGAALRFTIRKAGSQPYDVAANVPLMADINQGETVTIGFYARTISAETPDGEGRITVRFQQNAEPWPGFGDKQLTIGTNWDWYEVSSVGDRKIKRRDAIVALQLAGAKQVIEIGQAIVVKGAAAIAGGP